MRLTTLAFASALALSAAGASLAQPAPGAPGAPPPAGQNWREAHQAFRADMMQKHAERLRAILQLRPDQEPALQALLAAMQPPAGAMERWRAEQAEGQALTTPQKLDRMQARMAERQQAFARRAEAIKRFYAQLTPSQQKAFDALHADMGHGMHDHEMHGPGMHGPGMHGPGMHGPEAGGMGGPGMGPPQR